LGNWKKGITLEAMGTVGSKLGYEQMIKGLVTGILISKCILDLQVEIPRKLLKTSLNFTEGHIEKYKIRNDSMKPGMILKILNLSTNQSKQMPALTLGVAV
jgi:hypothetical protein